MLEEIKKFISEKENGLFLLDSPTGFGKTTAVINYLVSYLTEDMDKSKNRIFFVTNLKMNLPWKQLKDKIGDELFYKNCIVLESYADTVIRYWKNIGSININFITNSPEYISLNQDIEIFSILEEELKNENLKDEDKKRKRILKKNLENKIQDKSEPQFREFIKKNYFYGKSLIDKTNFINKNEWFKKLYPSSVLERYKVVFLTTAKFVNPIDTFHRMPFYIYDDSLLKNSIIFIDEFDSTKDIVLTNIIQQDLKIQIDLLKLFLNIHYSVENLIMPKHMLRVSNKLKSNIELNQRYKTPEELIQVIKNEFTVKYKKYKFSLSLKSEGLEKEKTFLYFDGKPFTIVKDNSKKNIYIKEDLNNQYNKIYSENSKLLNSKNIKTLISDLNYSINFFIRGLVYLSDNYMNLKNQTLDVNTQRYTIDESIMSIISILNISNEFVQTIFQRAIEYYDGKELENNEVMLESDFMRKGFNFTEIEDDRSHDLQSKFHAFYFHTTPEDILIRMANKANIVGVSATASLNTVIGNYDIKYLKKQLSEFYYDISIDGKERIKTEFEKQLQIYEKNDININIIPIDDINKFSDEEKLFDIINNKLGLNENSKQKLIEQYRRNVSNCGNLPQNENSRKYYQLIKYKLAFCYRYFGCNKDIKSFLCFNNFTIKSNSSIKEEELKELFKIIAKDNNFEYIKPYFVSAENFSQIFETSKSILSKGLKVFWISTYKTIGSGKNIQYEIPDCVKDSVFYDTISNRNDKDFDGIYLCTPTNLTQNLSYDSNNKYEDLSKYLFQQEYLRQNKNLSYQAMKQNIIRGFKKIFYNLEDIFYPNNGDLLYHNAQIIIQALGRICRCRNKNKNIHILSDVAVIDRLQKIEHTLEHGIYNKEFVSLYKKTISKPDIYLDSFSKINKMVSNDVKLKAWTVRNSLENVKQWQDIRDYILKNPTSNFINENYRKYYFQFNEEYSGYSYNLNKNGDFDSINLINKYEEKQVSDTDCCLNLILEIDEVYQKFIQEGYATKFKTGKFLMTPALYKQVYVAALGEVAGKIIIETQLGDELQEIEDYSKYELFDFHYNKFYFDFKHWDQFIIDNESYCNKIRNKLKKVEGEKCFIINLICNKDTEYKCQNINDEIYIVPFLIDSSTGEISYSNINFILVM